MYFSTKFHVINISASYICLLGRPWIHMAGAVPLSLHQMVKFVWNDQIVTVKAETEIMVATLSSISYVEEEDVEECSFWSLEIINIVYVAEGMEYPKPCLSVNTKLGIKETVGRGCRAGYGLGKNLQGRSRALSQKEKRGKEGLGYKPSRDDIERTIRNPRIEKKRED